MKKYILMVVAFLQLGLSGCNEKNSTRPSNTSTPAPPTAPQLSNEEIMRGDHIEGIYRATFTTLNPGVNGTLPGSATLFRKENKFHAYVRLFAGKVSAWHPQFVYSESHCPKSTDDTNQDGFIDIEEAEKVTGPILFPLDADLSSQQSGRRYFPLADLSGSYSYERITSFKSFLEDLYKVDPDPEDDLIKLDLNTPLKLLGKSVMILGIDEKTILPESVKGKGKLKPYQTLPIACGLLNITSPTVGATYSPDDIGPVSDVVDDQDQPAPEEPETPENENGRPYGSSNETTEGEVTSEEGENNF